MTPGYIKTLEGGREDRTQPQATARQVLHLGGVGSAEPQADGDPRPFDARILDDIGLLELEFRRRVIAAVRSSPEIQAMLEEEERLILYGDPTKPGPRGILNA